MDVAHLPNWLIFCFISGQAYFWGLALITLACGLAFASALAARVAVHVLVVAGIACIALSSTPSPSLLQGVGIVALASWVIAEQAKTRNRRLRAALRGAVAAICLTAVAAEATQRRAVHIGLQSPLEALYVVGDSISSGIGPDETTWPSLLAQTRGIEVVNLARGGVEVNEARQQVRQIPDRPAMVLLEIGGNDLLRDRSAESFATDLRRLVAEAQRPRRVLVMLELPLTPFRAEYCAVQRRLAREFNVTLIPRSVFAAVLTAEGATLDGIHLSEVGHAAMAEAIWDHIGPAFKVHSPG
jgi:acyl-CoA thioesterase I